MISLTYCNETGLKIFLGSCRQHTYLLCHNKPNFLSAILIYVENILFCTPHQPLVWFSPKSSTIIFRLCWQKVMDFVSIDATVFVQRRYKLWALCQNDSKAISLQSFDILTTYFVCAIVTSHWPFHTNLVTAPPIGQTW